MPRNERVLIVLVASPSDLEEERNSLEDVIRELNHTWSRTFGLRLELVKWETHGYPGFGSDPQDVLNQELPDDPDIFIGLMWGRFGTPTQRAGSGTEEEFKRAVERYNRDPQSMKIMFYFKDAPIAPSAIDPDQLRRVKDFKASIGSEGTLFWTFTEVEDFERLLRIHLARQIQEYHTTDPPQQIASSGRPDEAKKSKGEADELGLLDFMDIVEEQFGSLREIATTIAQETQSLGQSMTARTHEISEATAKAHGQLGRREARVLIERAADDMNGYVEAMEHQIPSFRAALEKGAEAAGRVALFSVGMMDSSGGKQVRETRDNLITLCDHITSAFDATESFKATIDDLPRMTSVMNRAKRRTAEVLADVLDSLANGLRILRETVKALDTILGEDQPPRLPS